ncbi:hypothetical protein [Zymobacter sp. IVIA_5232.4 C2]|uniref:hypothetical protein n=1 Tax=Zymobacter sp. IVIA_5232.4 C2 TaxID=3394855 RepID=UPI0039C47BD9
MNKLTKILSVCSGVSYLIGMFFIYMFKGGEYDWMLEMTPEIGNAPQSSDDWVFLSQFFFAFTLVTQVPPLFFSNRKYHVMMIIMAIVFYV